MNTFPDLTGAQWFKATASETAQGCVEVAHLAEGAAVRDSQNPDAAVLFFTPHEWACFLDGVHQGEFTRATK